MKNLPASASVRQIITDNTNNSDTLYLSTDMVHRQHAQAHTEEVTHTGDCSGYFSYTETESDIADLVSWYACLQEDVKRKGTDLRRRAALVRFHRVQSFNVRILKYGQIKAFSPICFKIDCMLTVDMPDSWLKA